MTSVIIWTISILASGWFILGGTSQVFPYPSLTPAIMAIVWIVVLETTVFLAYRSTKKKNFR